MTGSKSVRDSRRPLKAKVREDRRQEVIIPKEPFKLKFWDEQDGRSIAVREIRRRVEELERDCGAESYQQRSLCQRAIFIELELETMEINAHRESREIDRGIYTQAVNCLQGIYSKLGLKRQTPKAMNVKAVVAKYSKERA